MYIYTYIYTYNVNQGNPDRGKLHSVKVAFESKLELKVAFKHMAGKLFLQSDD